MFEAGLHTADAAEKAEDVERAKEELAVANK